MKNSAKRLLAVMLALVLCLSLLPGIAIAADSYVKVTGLSDVTAGGQFVFVANGFAMDTTLQSNSKFNGIAVTPSGNALSGSLPVWTIEAVSGGIAISVNGQYLGYNSSTNFKMQADPYTWTVSVGNNGFQIKSAATNTRGIFLQTSSSRFGAYSTTNTSGYVFDLELYKLPDGTPSCDHTYTSEVTTALTCTQDGVDTYTCSKCGDTYTKTTKATGHDYVNGECTKCDAFIETNPAKIITEAFGLAEGESLGYDSTLVGKIISVDEEFSSTYNNITVTIAVEGYEDLPIKCYRLTGTGADALAVDDIISVTGMIKNYKGTIEFDSGCTLGKVTTGDDEPVGSDVAEILAAAYALAEGESLDGTYTLTGKITAIKDPYNPTYSNISVIIEIPGHADKPILCYRVAGEGAEGLLVDDTITVTGTITNYKGTIEFAQGCTLDNVISGGGTPPVAPEDPKQIVEEAYALAEGATLPYKATLTGVITEIVKYDETYGDLTVVIVVEGKDFECYAMKGENLLDLVVGDTITVTGTIKNYYGKIEFEKPTLDAVGAPVVGVTVSGAVTTGAVGDTTIELLAGEEVVATATVSGKTGTYSIENVAEGTYTLKVSKLNHVAREYTVTVAGEALTQDVKIHLIGDIDGGGSVNMGDVSSLYAHIKGTKKLTDEYQLLVANINGGSLNLGDFSTLYAHINGTKKLY